MTVHGDLPSGFGGRHLRILVVALFLGAAMRLGFATLLPPIVTPDATGRYERLARNLAAGHGYTRSSRPPYEPDAQNQPAYPLFLAAFELVAPGNRALVVAAQLVLELLTVLALAALAARAELSPGGRATVIAVALVCPILPTIARAIWSETLATALVVAAALLTVRAAREGRARDFALAGLAAALGLLTRSDLVPAVGLMAVAGAVGLWQQRPPHALRGVAIALVAAAIPMGAWMARNQRDLGKLQPMGGYVGQLDDAYQRWLATWVDDLDDMAPYWWYPGDPGYPKTYPPDKVVDANERDRANQYLALGRAGLRSPEGEAAFAELTARARQERPLRTFVLVPVKRLVNVWLNVVAAYTPRSLRVVAQAGWAVFLLLSFAGLALGLWRRDVVALLMAAIVAGRSVLPLLIGIACEPRYVVEALPACFLGLGYVVSAFNAARPPSSPPRVHP